MNKQSHFTNNFIWNNNLEKVILFIEKNKCKPSKTSQDKNIKKLGSWISYQQKNYKNMKNINLKIKWEQFLDKYKEYFINYNKIWDDNLEKVKLYIKKNNCRPSFRSNDNNVKKLGQWIIYQQKNNKYKNKWNEFLNEYKDYFLNNEEKWNKILDQVILYIEENNCRPSDKNKKPYIKQLGQWISKQLINYKKNKDIMINNSIKIKWEQFIDKYKKYFLSNEEIWNNNLEKVKTYIIQNSSKPLIISNDINTKHLASWLSHQQTNYKYKIKIMKNNNIKNKWEDFINYYL